MGSNKILIVFGLHGLPEQTVERGNSPAHPRVTGKLGAVAPLQNPRADSQVHTDSHVDQHLELDAALGFPHCLYHVSSEHSPFQWILF